MGMDSCIMDIESDNDDEFRTVHLAKHEGEDVDECWFCRYADDIVGNNEIRSFFDLFTQVKMNSFRDLE